MALNPIAFTEKVVRSFRRYQLPAYPFADEGLHGQMRRLLSLDETRKLPLLKGPYISLSRIPPGTWAPQLNEGQSMKSQRGFPLYPAEIIERLANAIKQIPEDDHLPALSVIRGHYSRYGRGRVDRRSRRLEILQGLRTVRIV